MRQSVLCHKQLKGTENKLCKMYNNAGLLSVFCRSNCVCVRALVFPLEMSSRETYRKSTQTSHRHVISENIGVAATSLAPNLHQALLSNYTAGAWPLQLVNIDQTPTRFAFSLTTDLSQMGLDAVCKGPTFVIDGNCAVLTSSGLNQRALRLVPRCAQEIGEFSAVKLCMSSLIKR